MSGAGDIDVSKAKVPLFGAIGAAVAVVLWATSIVGLYYGLALKIDGQSTKIEAQAEKIQELTTKLAVQESQLRAQERAVIELTITLRAKEVIK